MARAHVVPHFPFISFYFYLHKYFTRVDDHGFVEYFARRKSMVNSIK